MKRHLLACWVWLACLAPATMLGQGGDTTIVQAFSFSDPSPTGWSAPYRGTFEFPDTTNSWEKVLMYYTLKCDPATAHDNYNCGEWDYLTYIWVVDSSGTMDSTYLSNPTYSYISGTTPDSLPLSYQPLSDIAQHYQFEASYSDTTSYAQAQITTGLVPASAPFLSPYPRGRAQFLWKGAELSAQGLVAGDITSLKLDVASIGDSLSNLSIRLKETTQDSLSTSNFHQAGFTEVYVQSANFDATGWKDFLFYQPFTWDGTSDIVVDLSYDEPTGAMTTTLDGYGHALPHGVFTNSDPYYLDFDGSRDIVSIDQAVQPTGNAPRTIECWGYAESFNGGGLFQAGITGANSRDFSLRTMGTNNLWRVQLWGSYDFDVTVPNSLNAWHHYAVTFDGNTTKLYVDGQLVGQQNTPALNTGANDIWVGRWNNSRFNGKIDEFRVWNSALDEATIRDWMNRPLAAQHPQYNQLATYLPFDEGMGTMAADASGNGFDGALLGAPTWFTKDAGELAFGMEATQFRPNATFEQGVFTTQIDTVIYETAIPRDPVQVIMYGNSTAPVIIPENMPNHPSDPTDTLLIWLTENPITTFGPDGSIVSTQVAQKDTTIFRGLHEYYSNIVRYEIGRYITPYGIGLDLGPDGTRWIFDVTDYAPLLHDHVYLQAGNNQELLDLKFVMVEGTPARKVKKIENLWSGSFTYSALFNDTQAKAVSKTLDPDADSYAVRMRLSGHGFGGNSNCAEFCDRSHFLSIDGVQQFEWHVWNECADNFVYPQGGTWIYDRAGWCPGAPVSTYDFELTPLVTPGQTVSIDYQIEDPAPYAPEGNYIFRGQLITYEAQAYQHDVEVVEIMAPNNDVRFSRRNPICDNPRIEIRNNGATNLTKVYITYGVEGGIKPCYYIWQGDLAFGESEIVDLPLFNFFGLNAQNPVFFVQLDNPNGFADENPQNNRMETGFDVVETLPNNAIIQIRTNLAGFENSYQILDRDGNVVKNQGPMSTNTTYRDTLDLPLGCYTFHFKDEGFNGQDGISWWANNDGSGYVRILDPQGSILKTFEPDFGMDIFYEFTMGYTQGYTYFPELECEEFADTTTSVDPAILPSDFESLGIYPNPNAGEFSIELGLTRPQAIQIEVFNPLGQRVYTSRHTASAMSIIPMNLKVEPGVYVVNIATEGQRTSRTIVIQ
ncbi:LamG-like jellyroll fold domain-containing protein [Pontibacter sp. G13]|uniref:LamG-like jellyroll fold domain-containing protein n=1 Tax=Pontibacter sp. G13 TaxID=3074898 RepID=UPI00288BCEAF|nr:LamG-like jellyroll fold domain-containing protein [Pontibacter sp. G13]WNJ15983.1 LamG-like jellyroll fold domain-containing protein [Pontibacter sp. G13]